MGNRQMMHSDQKEIDKIASRARIHKPLHREMESRRRNKNGRHSNTLRVVVFA